MLVTLMFGSFFTFTIRFGTPQFDWPSNVCGFKSKRTTDSFNCASLCHESQVTDDEGVQGKAFNYAWERLKLRGISESETSHPCWNSFRKAVARAGLTITVMKITLICNWAPNWLNILYNAIDVYSFLTSYLFLGENHVKNWHVNIWPPSIQVILTMVPTSRATSWSAKGTRLSCSSRRRTSRSSKNSSNRWQLIGSSLLIQNWMLLKQCRNGSRARLSKIEGFT